MLRYLGLRHPYRFDRALVVLAAVLMLSAVAIAVMLLAARSDLTSFGPRAAYFLYLVALLILAVLLVRWPWVSVTVLILAAVELGWGIGSYALRHTTLGQMSLLAPDAVEPPRFRWHALLQAVPIPSVQIRSATGLTTSHTSQGTRGRDPEPGSLANRAVVATYGGSATYDIATSQDDTWSDRLAEALGPDRFFVVNHGVPGYTTAEHVIQTGYADFHLPSQVDSLRTRRIGGSQVTVSPLLTVLSRLVSAETDTVRYSIDPYAQEPASGEIPELSARGAQRFAGLLAPAVRDACR